jgi:hypothetical protein
MADNTDEGHSENLTNTQSENTSDEIIPIKETETTEPNQEAENMEVHHHPDLHHKPKPWKEYFLEFIMIFLAVTLGFFAEQIRENITDQHREKEYMKSMIEDLMVDTTSLSSNIRLRQQRDKMIDSLMYLLNSPEVKQNGNAIYFFARSTSPPIYFFPDDRTIQQLKSTGSLRLISNMRISSSIMDYDRKMRQQIFEYTDEQDDRAEYRQIAMKIFDGKVFNEMISGNTIERPTNNPQLFTYDATLMNEYIIQAQFLRKVNQNQLRRAEELFTQAKELTTLIKKEYHLE